MPYTAIPSSWRSVGKAIAQQLVERISDNLDWLYGQSVERGLMNGSFEIDSDADGIPDNWTRSLYPGGSSAIETANPEHGKQAIKFSHPGGSGNGGGFLESDYVEVAELRTYYIQFILWATWTSGSIRNIVNIGYYDKDKVYLSNTDLYDTTITSSLAAANSAQFFVPPSGTRYVKVNLVGGYYNTDGVGDIFFDGVVLGQAMVQDALQTAMGSVSTGSSSANLTLPGGEYGFYPQTKSDGTADTSAHIRAASTGSTYLTIINLGYSGFSGTSYAQQRYIQASPPYDLGDGDIHLFVFALIDRASGAIEAVYTAEDPPWAHNGPTDSGTIVIENGVRKRKRLKRRAKRVIDMTSQERAAFIAGARSGDHMEEIPLDIPANMKNADMDIVPHPFQGNDLTGKEVVLIDPVGSFIEDLHALHKAGESINELLHTDYLRIDNAALNRAVSPGVKAYAGKWKNT